MRFTRVAVAVLYLAAVTASAGTPLCVGTDGHRVYEVSFGTCCDPHEDGHHEHDACGEPERDHLEAGPECGLCDDSLALLHGGLKTAPAVAAVLNGAPAIGDVVSGLSVVAALDAAPVPLPTRLTLRC